jgi:hypothetical protein
MFFVRLSDMTGQGPTSWYRVEVVIVPLYLDRQSKDEAWISPSWLG